jgi:adenosylhomocysteine nucleosidase
MRVASLSVFKVIVAVTGLAREARIVGGPGVVTVTGGGNARGLREKLSLALAETVHGIISIGIAGGLAPSLKPGDCVVATEVVEGRERFAANEAWTGRMIARLPYAELGAIAGTDAIIANVAAKVELFGATGALAVDMESHIAAKLAQAHSLPFVVLRVVADAAESELPHAASVALGPDGKVKLGAVLYSVVRQPHQIPALIGAFRDSKTAFAALLRCRDALGIGLAGPDVREPLLDMG